MWKSRVTRSRRESSARIQANPTARWFNFTHRLNIDVIYDIRISRRLYYCLRDISISFLACIFSTININISINIKLDNTRKRTNARALLRTLLAGNANSSAGVPTASSRNFFSWRHAAIRSEWLRYQYQNRRMNQHQ